MKRIISIFLCYRGHQKEKQKRNIERKQPLWWRRSMVECGGGPAGVVDGAGAGGERRAVVEAYGRRGGV